MSTNPLSRSDTRSGKRIDFHQIRIVYPKGSIIFDEGDARGDAFIIESGIVEISVTKAQKHIALVRLGQGEVFGEAALLGEGKRTARATAVEDTEVFLISPALLRDRITKLDPLVGLLMSLLVSRYRQWRHKSTDEVGEPNLIPTEQDGLHLVDRADDFMKDLHIQREIALNELRTAQEIAQAIDMEQFVPHIQPIVTLPEGEVAGFEALIRWEHPDRGMISPIDFIPVAERTNVVWDLDMMMLRRACQLVPDLNKVAQGKEVYVSVNLSAAHFEDETLVTEIEKILAETGGQAGGIVLEITESALMGNPDVAEKVLLSLKKRGFRIALDDFGTGYSSLGYLHRFSIDILKIDRSFVRDIHKNRRGLDIVRAIVGMAKNFNLKIVAEGIEDAEEVYTLSGLGIDFAQGYHFSKPLPVDKAMAYLKEKRD